MTPSPSLVKLVDSKWIQLVMLHVGHLWIHECPQRVKRFMIAQSDVMIFHDFSCFHDPSCQRICGSKNRICQRGGKVGRGFLGQQSSLANQAP